MKSKIATIFVFIFLVFPLFAFAEETGGICSGPIVPDCAMGACTLCHLFELLVNAMNFLLICIVPFIATFLFLYGGIVFYTSGGVPEKVQKGKDIIIHTIIGIIIVYGAWVFVNSFLTIFGMQDEWAQIECEVEEGPEEPEDP